MKQEVFLIGCEISEQT